MNGKFEEKLAQLAFGDLSPEEAARIEAQVQKNPEAARALAEYREMRGGLRGLSQIPEHQLSNERLRDAILTQGLRPQAAATQPSRGFGAAWLWMPVAACVLGFSIISLRHQPAADPQIVLNNGGTSVASNYSFSGSTATSSGDFGTRLAMMGAPKTKPVTASITHKTEIDPSDTKALPKSMRASRFTEGTTEIHPHWGPIAPEENPNTRLAQNDKPAAAPNTAAPANPAATSSPIVLIDSTTDAETGAPTATEVGTASNVLVGG